MPANRILTPINDDFSDSGEGPWAEHRQSRQRNARASSALSARSAAPSSRKSSRLSSRWQISYRDEIKRDDPALKRRAPGVSRSRSVDPTRPPEQQWGWVRHDAAGWAELVEWLRGFSLSAIGLEASGGYERGVMRALLAAGMSVRQTNPFKLRQFRQCQRSSRQERSARRADYRVVRRRHAGASGAAEAPAIEQLAEMVTVRRQLSEQKVAAEDAARLLEDAMLQRLSRRRIAGLVGDIGQLDERLVEIAATDTALAHRCRVLTSMPGVGPMLACTLMHFWPSLTA